MDAETPPPLPPDTWDALPSAVPLLIQGLQAQASTLRTEVAALQARVRDLESRLGQDSSNSSRPPSSDPPHATKKRQASPTRRKRGGQPGHPGTFRSLLPVEQVDEVVVVVPEHCRHCQHAFPSAPPRRQSRVWRQQVVELLPLAVRVTEYQMHVRRCPTCGRRTRASLPVGVALRRFGPRLTAVVALLSGRYRLSRREVQQVLVDLWEVKLALGTVLRQERVQSVALAPVVEEVRRALHQADVVNMDETGWRQEQKRAWLWTAATANLTVFLVDRSRGVVLRAPEARLPSVGGPWWRRGVDRTLGVGGNRAGVCAVASLSRWGV
jgi:transposase